MELKDLAAHINSRLISFVNSNTMHQYPEQKINIKNNDFVKDFVK